MRKTHVVCTSPISYLSDLKIVDFSSRAVSGPVLHRKVLGSIPRPDRAFLYSVFPRGPPVGPDTKLTVFGHSENSNSGSDVIVLFNDKLRFFFPVENLRTTESLSVCSRQQQKHIQYGETNAMWRMSV